MFTIVTIAAGSLVCFTALLGFALCRAAALGDAAALTLDAAPQLEEHPSVA